jgi:hypothetical protein
VSCSHSGSVVALTSVGQSNADCLCRLKSTVVCARGVEKGVDHMPRSGWGQASGLPGAGGGVPVGGWAVAK